MFIIIHFAWEYFENRTREYIRMDVIKISREEKNEFILK